MVVAMRRSGRTGRFLGKKEIFDVPIMGPVMKALGGIRVDRQGTDDTTKGDALDPLMLAANAIAGGESSASSPRGPSRAARPSSPTS